jgi:hypothetical protein
MFVVFGDDMRRKGIHLPKIFYSMLCKDKSLIEGFEVFDMIFLLQVKDADKFLIGFGGFEN